MDDLTHNDVVSLREYLQAQINDINARISLAYESHGREHSMEQLAIKRAAEMLSSKLETMNEFRAQLVNERTSYITQDVYYMKHDALEAKIMAVINVNSLRISAIERAQSGAQGSLWMLGGAFAVITALLGLFFRFWHTAP